MSAAALNPDRLRQMAILVSIVDTAAAHELLSRLPADTSQKVLSALSNLGEVSEEEKSEVLQLVQSEQFGLGPSPADSTDAEAPSDSTEDIDEEIGKLLEDDEDLAGDPNSIWAQLDRNSIVEFLRHERPAVIAVVLSQLSATVAVRVLQELGPTTSGDAMRCLARMHDVDDATRESLDNYIKERLGEAQLDVLPVPKFSKRVAAMLKMASPEWRETWQTAIHEPRTIRVIDEAPEAARGRQEQLAAPRESQLPTPRPDSQLRPIPGTIVQLEEPPQKGARSAPNPNTNVDAYQEILARRELEKSQNQSAESHAIDPNNPAESLAALAPQQVQDLGVFSTSTVDLAGAPANANSKKPARVDTVDVSRQKSIAPETTPADQLAHSHASNSSQHTPADSMVSIPFPQQSGRHVVDRTFLQMEFEKVLSLSPTMLAELLGSVSPETVLLALAGAPPKWMKRFYKMLNRKDAKSLEQKLRSIGALKISDIDLAQSQIVDRANELRSGSSNIGTHSTRAAA